MSISLSLAYNECANARSCRTAIHVDHSNTYIIYIKYKSIPMMVWPIRTVFADPLFWQKWNISTDNEYVELANIFCAQQKHYKMKIALTVLHIISILLSYFDQTASLSLHVNNTACYLHRPVWRRVNDWVQFCFRLAWFNRNAIR